MSYVLKYLFEFYRWAMNEKADPRVQGWVFMDSLSPLLLLQALYIYIVLKLGPDLMKNRKALNLNKLMIIYNAFQILTNTYISWTVGSIVLRKFNSYCNQIDYSYDAEACTLLRGAYLYFLTKVLDLLDTIFFVLRKKESQVTFLHVYHHWVMLFYSWIMVKFFGGGHAMIGVMVNTFVHVCMYSYYLLSVFDSKFKTSFFWKRRITEIQLIQFLIGLFCSSGPILTKHCQFPLFPVITSVLQYVFFFLLFLDFYVKAYLISGKKHVNNMQNFPKKPVICSHTD